MLFRGISFRLSSQRIKQKEALELLWAFFAAKYSVQDIRVLAYNRTKNYMEYVFGLKDNGDMDLEPFSSGREALSHAQFKDVLVPEKGWSADRYIENWDEILSDGTESGEETRTSTNPDEGYRISERRLTDKRNAFSYQMIEGETAGFRVKNTMQYPPLECLQPCDLDSVIRLYRMALGTPGCVWDENYPSKELLTQDIEAGDLYGIRNPEGEVIAAVAKDRDEEVDSLPFWTKEHAPGAELARLVVHEGWKNQGLARVLHIQVQKELARRGFRSVHFLVAESNEPARRSYEALEYRFCGETEMFGHHYFCYEKPCGTS